ncbi:MAG: cytochrome C biogenesis protein CcmC [Deltaproteobacteria bacterium]|nr:cytochrome C biogenesis protein CcmC [Deltaproteobacteria bacterium]
MRDAVDHLMPWLCLLATSLLLTAQWFIWVHVPEEATMGMTQKIFYFHLPMAWVGLACFFAVFVTSVGVLAGKGPGWDLLAGACAEVGVLTSGLALATGSLWARAAWNTWWTWDPRLTTTIIMWFVYVGYLVLRRTDLGGLKRTRIAAVVGVVAFLDVPLVFLSARMWRSIHPAVFASEGGGLEPEMWNTILVSSAAFLALAAVLVLLRLRQGLAAHRIDVLVAGFLRG